MGERLPTPVLAVTIFSVDVCLAYTPRVNAIVYGLSCIAVLPEVVVRGMSRKNEQIDKLVNNKQAHSALAYC